MKILFDICHPAHVHLFKYLIFWLRENGHQVIVASRDKDLTIELLDLAQISHQCISKASKTTLGNIFELISRDYNLFLLHLKHHFDFAIGTSASIGHLSALSRVISLNFNEDDDAVVPLYALTAYPFASWIINPVTLNYKYWGEKRIKHDSYHELAYLHPNTFTADLKIISKYKIKPYQYIVIRKSSLHAHHDTNAKGLEGNLWNEILELTKKLERILSIEGLKSHEIEPQDMHHILAHAKLVISDSQTMTAQAAVLGTPSVRFNSFAGKLSYLNELEHKYELTYSFLPGQEKECLKKIQTILSSTNMIEEWQIKKRRMLEDKIDFNSFMIQLFNDLATSIR